MCNKALELIAPDKSGEIPHLAASFIFKPSITPSSS